MSAPIQLKPEYGFFRIIGEPFMSKGKRLVRAECAGPKCKGHQTDVQVSNLVNGRTRSCRACARWRALRTGFGMGGYMQGGRIE